MKEAVASITAYITEDTNMFFLLKNFQMSKDLRVELTAASCNCNCINCCNNVEHETDRFKAIKGESYSHESGVTGLRWGFQREGRIGSGALSLGIPERGSHWLRCPFACITFNVIEATCACLLAQAEEAEKEGYSVYQAEQMILEEFGQCLTQIVQSTLKSGTVWDSKSKKPCNCTKSQCLKLNCNCINCCNNVEHETDRFKAIKPFLHEQNIRLVQYLVKARLCGVQGESYSHGSTGLPPSCAESLVFQREGHIGSGALSLGIPERGSHWLRCPFACITFNVIEATCACLLAQAEEAEKEGYSVYQAEQMILEEFGQCLTQIVQSTLKSGGL
ncbi:UNVERIFIED_CONTAM: hypothetical protein FKN15_009588 [Acipenser sinensis]